MKRISLLIVLCAVLFAASLAGAQVDTPLIMLIDYDLWAWNPESALPTMYTMNGYIAQPVVSPNGTEVAYAAYAPITIDALMRHGGIGGGALPTDIWVMNTLTRETRPVAVQPPDASFVVEGVEDRALMRSQPAWSSDGTMLAWTELVIPGGGNRLMVYDLTSSASRVAWDNFAGQAGVPTPMDVIWGGPVMVVRSVEVAPSGQFVESLLMYDENGNTYTSIPIPEGRVIDSFMWAEYNGEQQVLVRFAEGGWTVYEWFSGAELPLNGLPEMYAAFAPTTSLSLAPMVDEQGRPIWQVYDAAGQPAQRFSSAPYFAPHRITLSPDGQAIAFSEFMPESSSYENVVRVLRGSAGANIPDVAEDQIVLGLAWGPMAWRVRQSGAVPSPVPPVPTPVVATPQVSTPPVAVVCPGAPAPRLVAGDTGLVLGTTPNNVRAQPGVTSGQIIGQIPAGATFTVLEGPVCSDSLIWFRVDYRGLNGWTAEGQGSEYWLEPLR